MRTVDKLKQYLEPGQVYRRSELTKISNSIDRNLRELVDSGELKKLWFGVYYYPKKSTFGDVPADAHKVIATFLKGQDFLMLSPIFYNGLGVGTTQLYNERFVYNNKRSGHFELARQKYFFKNRKFPKEISEEFLLIDLVNNINLLEEDKDEVMKRVVKKAQNLGVEKMRRIAKRYGLNPTRKFFEQISNRKVIKNAE